MPQRDARDARIRGRFVASLAALASLFHIPHLYQPLSVAPVTAEGQPQFPEGVFPAVHQLLELLRLKGAAGVTVEGLSQLGVTTSERKTSVKLEILETSSKPHAIA